MARAVPLQVPDQLCLGFIAMLVGKETSLCKTSEDNLFGLEGGRWGRSLEEEKIFLLVFSQHLLSVKPGSK